MILSVVSEFAFKCFDHMREFFLCDHVAQPQMNCLIGPFGRHGRWDRQHLSKNRKSDFKPVHRVCWHIDQVVGPVAAGKPRDGDPPLAFGDVDKPRCRMAAHCFGPPPSGARVLGN